VSQAEEEEPTLPPEAEAALLGALEAALRPEPLDPETNERLLELVLEDPLAPPSAEELVESARLRDALSTGAGHEADGLLGALRAPFGGRHEHAEAVERALTRAFLPKTPAAARGKVIYAWFGAASAALVAAAALVLFVNPPRQEKSAAAAAVAPALVRPHTTAALFADRFETSSTSERMDLIASARGRDLRDNRYAAWGVR
jgi:hypothetical protein